jgi:hypothetical protein
VGNAWNKGGEQTHSYLEIERTIDPRNVFKCNALVILECNAVARLDGYILVLFCSVDACQVISHD